MWLPETAVDLETLELLAEFGLRFTILAPHQAARVRRIGEAKWHELKRLGPSTAPAPTSNVCRREDRSRCFFMTARSRAPWLSRDCFRTAIVSSKD